MKRALAPVMLGLFAGVDTLGSGIAFATLLFPASLAAGLGTGVGVILVSAAVLSLVLAWRSTCKTGIPLVQETSIAILAAAIAGLLPSLALLPPENRTYTILVILGTSTLLTGVLFWLSGRLGFGTLVRFLPYPVVAGFLAGSGWLLVEGGLMMITGHHTLIASLQHLRDPLVQAKALPAVIFAVLMVVVLRRSNHPMAVSGLMIGGAAAFYGLLFLSGTSVEQARLWHWLPTVSGDSQVSLPVPTTLIAGADWSAVVAVLPAMISAALLNMLGLLLNLSGLELAQGKEIDTNAELRANGLANLLAGGLGGASGFIGLGVSLLADRIGTTGRSAGIATALVILAGVAWAPTLAAAMPYFLSAGLMLFMGLELLLEWLVASRHSLPRRDWLIIVFILATTITTGFLTGLAVGLAISVLLFVYTYSRQPVIRLTADGRTLRSSVDRAATATHALNDLGQQILILRLQGYLFFGTVEQVIREVKALLNSPTGAPCAVLILDFRHVSGLDSAAVSGFVRICGLTEGRGVTVVFSQLTDSLQQRLCRSGLPLNTAGRAAPLLLTMPDLDHALEYSETLLLERLEGPVDTPSPIDQILQDLVGDHPRLNDMVAAMTCRALCPGDILIRTGDTADDLYILASGQVKVQITLADGRPLRLRTMTAGAIVGEIAHYLGGRRTADVIVETPVTLYCLSRQHLLHLENADSGLALLFHRLLAVTLAEKLVLANRQIQSLQQT